MNELEYKILTHIRQYHKGSERAVRYKKLSTELHINSRILRDSVADIVTSGEGCIGTNSTDGYFYITNDEELNYCHIELISRIKKLARRAKGLRKAREKDRNIKVEQQELFICGGSVFVLTYSSIRSVFCNIDSM